MFLREIRPVFAHRRDLLLPGIRKRLDQLGLPMDLAEAILTDELVARAFDHDDYDAVDRHPAIYWWPWSMLWEGA